LSGYDPLLDWVPAEELTDSSVRNVAIKDRYGNVVVSGVDDVQDDDRAIDLDNFFKDDGDAENDVQKYYSDEHGEYEDEPPPTAAAGDE
jgi:hypothetical protein